MQDFCTWCEVPIEAGRVYCLPCGEEAEACAAEDARAAELAGVPGLLGLLSEDAAAHVRAALAEIGAGPSQVWRVGVTESTLGVVAGGAVQAEIRPAGPWREATERTWSELGRVLIAAGGVMQEGPSTRAAYLVRPGCVLSVCWSTADG